MDQEMSSPSDLCRGWASAAIPLSTRTSMSGLSPTHVSTRRTWKRDEPFSCQLTSGTIVDPCVSFSGSVYRVSIGFEAGPSTHADGKADSFTVLRSTADF
jgi:hypothetical protein